MAANIKLSTCSHLSYTAYTKSMKKDECSNISAELKPFTEIEDLDFQMKK